MEEGLLLAAIGLVFAGIVKGAIGFGLPIVATMALAGVLGGRTAVVVLSVVNCVSALVILVMVRGIAYRKYSVLFLVVGAAMALGAVLGAHLMAMLSDKAVTGMFGFVAIVFTLISAFGRQLGSRLSISGERLRSLGPIIGIGAGVIGGITSVFSLPMAIYLQAIKTPKREFLVVLNALLAVTTMAQVGSYFQLGFYTPEIVRTIALTAVCVGVGLLMGNAIQKRVNQAVFNLGVTVIILISAADLVRRSLFG
ncbi:MAG: sulfite exporter TauE/SafE family protein [Chloroflexi bacterium]|nr:sulfite exporter TauE/SafE family protein [Chloroflexota bacterium]